jgi:hypothetical protein
MFICMMFKLIKREPYLLFINQSSSFTSGHIDGLKFEHVGLRLMLLFVKEIEGGCYEGYEERGGGRCCCELEDRGFLLKSLGCGANLRTCGVDY